jgi:putative peptidoglycan lipid II flippase
VLLQSHNLFTLPALAISMNSVGLIVGAVILAPMLKVGASIAQVGPNNIYGLAWGAVLSAILYLIVQLPGLRQLRAPLRPIFDWRVPGVVSVLRLMVPRMVGLAVVQINFIVNVTLAGMMANGSITALQTAWTLMFTSLGVIAQAISSALFPSLAALHSEGDIVGFKDRLSGAMRTVLFLALPAAVAFIVFGRPIVQIFERGNWTPVSTAATSWALGFYAVGLAGFALLEVLSRAFYARGDTRTPVVIGVMAMLSNIVLSVLFVAMYNAQNPVTLLSYIEYRLTGTVFMASFGPNQLAHGPFGYLALANALTTLVEAAVLWWMMRRRIGDMGDRSIFMATFKAGIAACVMGLVLIVIQRWREETGLITLILGGIIGGGVFFVLSAALGLPEARSVPAIILRRIRR